MNKNQTKKIILNGLMIALVFLATRFTTIPGPISSGYFNLGDVVIIVTAILLGRKSGFIAGAVGSCLADISASAFIFAPVTLIVKGLEGYIVGVIASGEGDKKSSEILKIIGVIVGALVMVAGYFVAELYILKLFDPTFGYTAAISELPLNLVQGGISAVVGYVLVAVLDKVNIRRYILE